MPLSAIEQNIRSIDHRIAMKRVELAQKELKHMDDKLSLYSVDIENTQTIFNQLLLRDKPVGGSIKAIRYIKNECNCFDSKPDRRTFRCIR
jgi:hypothetical protein